MSWSAFDPLDALLLDCPAPGFAKKKRQRIQPEQWIAPPPISSAADMSSRNVAQTGRRKRDAQSPPPNKQEVRRRQKRNHRRDPDLGVEDGGDEMTAQEEADDDPHPGEAEPGLRRQDLLDHCVDAAVRKAKAGSSSSSAEAIVDAYVPTADTMRAFERLDVLVCGRCQSVFHLVDEFRSHASTCAGEESSLSLVGDGGGNSTEHALAMVLWCNTIRRMMQQSRVLVEDSDNVGRRIQQKWFCLSKKSKSGWLKAASALRELGQLGKIVFGGKEHYGRLVEEFDPGRHGHVATSLSQIKQEVDADKYIEASVAAGRLPKVLVAPVAKPFRPGLGMRPEKPGRPGASPEPGTSSGPSFESSSLSVAPSSSSHFGIVDQIIAQRGSDFYVLYKNRSAAVWHPEAELDPNLVRSFKERAIRIQSSPEDRKVNAEATTTTDQENPPKRKRGRPRKYPLPAGTEQQQQLLKQQQQKQQHLQQRQEATAKLVDEGLKRTSHKPQQEQRHQASKRTSHIRAMSRFRRWAKGNVSSSGNDMDDDDEEEEDDDDVVRHEKKLKGKHTESSARGQRRREERSESQEDDSSRVDVIQLGGSGPKSLAQAARNLHLLKRRNLEAVGRPETEAAKRRPKGHSGRSEDGDDDPDYEPRDDAREEQAADKDSTKETPKKLLPRLDHLKPTGGDADRIVSPSIASLLPEGFEMTKHVTDHGAVEYRVKKKQPAKTATTSEPDVGRSVKGSNLIRLTYQPSLEDEDDEDADLEQPPGVMTSRRPPMGEGVSGGVAKRSSPASHEVTSTTDSAVSANARMQHRDPAPATSRGSLLLRDDCAELYSVDGRTGMLVDRGGRPLQTTVTEMAAGQQHNVAQHQTVVSQGGVSYITLPQSEAVATNQQQSSFVFAESGVIDLDQMNSAGYNQFFQSVANGGMVLSEATEAPARPTGTNRVLLVLPTGEGVLTDLTDEQCGQFNIQLDSLTAQQQQVQSGHDSYNEATMAIFSGNQMMLQDVIHDVQTLETQAGPMLVQALPPTASESEYAMLTEEDTIHATVHAQDSDSPSSGPPQDTSATTRGPPRVLPQADLPDMPIIVESDDNKHAAHEEQESN